MSFLTLFTADAAAHGHEFSPKKPPIELSRTPSIVSTVPEDLPVMQSTPVPKKPPRTKTSYHLAQPPPTSHRHSLKAQRGLIVQVQKLSNSSRPIPTLDVLPAAALGSKLKKLHQHCLNHIVGQQDLILVRSEQYDHADLEEDEATEAREVVASISPTARKVHADEGRQRTTMISLAEGLQWEVNGLVSGGYEFVSYDTDGSMRVAKWLPKQPNKRRSYNSRTPSEQEERRFQFSILDSQTRKRPIIAWMSQQKLDVLDRYPGHAITSPPMSPAGTPPESNIGELGSALARESYYEDIEYNEITDDLRFLVIATGVWVALREGFVGNHQIRSDEISSSISPGLRPGLTSRVSGLGDTAAASRGSISLDEAARRRLLRHGTMVGHQATTNSIPKANEDDEIPQRSRSLGTGTRTHKAYSLSRLSRTFGKSTVLDLPEINVEKSISRPETPPLELPQESPPVNATTPLPFPGTGTRSRRAYSISRLSQPFGKGAISNFPEANVGKFTSQPETPHQELPTITSRRSLWSLPFSCRRRRVSSPHR